ncbi:putative 24.1 kDa heat shock protein, mitochondrial [Iris pallida]|uniref:24.1 kDa heat shock protein, mitochondrial n=1 Tax=Iris pallida TaxID=29817 RepID=A0AAX6HKE2_IRIPA|nr:putative 24.1 kDa heat shock protein, mitochondrial [Iris pallida]
MAAMIACRRAPVSKLLERLLAAGSPARSFAPSSTSAFRSFNTNTQMMVETDDERAVDVDRRRSRRGDDDYPYFPDVFSPFNSTRSSLSQLLNLMDQVTGASFPAPARGMDGGLRRGWDAREDADALHLRIDMPGLGKEHVKVSAEQNTLIIRGEGEKEGEGEEGGGRRYSSRIDLPEGMYKMDAIKAEMKNGVLKVSVPKVKQEERKDVFEVQIE